VKRRLYVLTDFCAERKDLRMNELRKCRALLLAQQQHIVQVEDSCLIQMKEHAHSIVVTIKASPYSNHDDYVIHITKDWMIEIDRPSMQDFQIFLRIAIVTTAH